MNKQILTIFLSLMLWGSPCLAGIRFIATDKSNSDASLTRETNGMFEDQEENSDTDIDFSNSEVQEQENNEEALIRACQYEGFTNPGCPQGYRPIGECPYNNNYYAGCCPPQYQYLPRDCLEANKSISKESCMGYYACE